MMNPYVVSGCSLLALQEDLETHVQDLCRVLFDPHGEWIRAEISEVHSFSARELAEWGKLEIHYEGKVYTLDRLDLYSHISGEQVSFSPESTAALFFKPSYTLN
jgi:hypothetical protein